MASAVVVVAARTTSAIALERKRQVRIACLVGMNEREVGVDVKNLSEEEVEKVGREKARRKERKKSSEEKRNEVKKRNSRQTASECENMLTSEQGRAFPSRLCGE